MFNFNTGFYEKGALVMQRKHIVINYLKTWFMIDLLASFPYSWIVNLSQGRGIFESVRETML